MKKVRWITASVLALACVGIVFFTYRTYRSPLKHGLAFHPAELVPSGVDDDGIPPIDEPKFESVNAADQYLKDEGFGLDVERNGEHRFYPFQLLGWHEVVNDQFQDKPLLVTFSPLTFTGAVFDRTVRGEVFSFGTSGDVLNGGLVMKDMKTHSAWSQLFQTAIDGELKGEPLLPYVSRVVAWKNWKHAFPTGHVLTRDTGSVRDYTLDPYGGYAGDQRVLFPLSHADNRLRAKELVYGVRMEQTHSAYTAADVARLSLINDVVGQPIVVFMDPTIHAVRAFSRIVDDQALTFAFKNGALVDSETHTTWTFDGRAVAGSYKNRTLDPIQIESAYWFAWSATYPDTDVYRGS